MSLFIKDMRGAPSRIRQISLRLLVARERKKLRAELETVERDAQCTEEVKLPSGRMGRFGPKAEGDLGRAETDAQFRMKLVRNSSLCSSLCANQSLQASELSRESPVSLMCLWYQGHTWRSKQDSNNSPSVVACARKKESCVRFWRQL